MTFWNFWTRADAPVTGHPDPDPGEELSVDSNGWLTGYDVIRVPSVRSSSLTTLGEVPLGIVLHYTATAHGTAKNLANRIRTFDRTKDRAASWNLLIAHDGVLWQSISFERGAWHCAKGRLDGHTINRSTIGIELEGYGKAPLPEPQVRALKRVFAAVLPHYRIPHNRAALEHRTYDPSRRSDPGDEWARTAAEILRGM